ENRLRVFDRPANTFSVNLVEVALEKKAEEPGMAGFRVDFDVGRDVPFFRAAGFEAGNFDIQQAFVTYKAPLGEGLSITFGKFVSLMGSEMIDSPDNFNTSRSFLFGFSQPFTHTGLVLTYPLVRGLDLSVGLVNGWDNIDDNNDAKTFLGRLMYTAEHVTVALAGIYGAEQTDRESPKRWVIDLTAMIMPLPRLHLMVNYDYGREDEAVVTATGFADATWQGIAVIVHMAATDKFGLSVRGEFFNDEDGARTGTVQDLWEITLTAAYKWVKGFETRLEYRHDRANVASFDREGRPTKNQDTISAEFIYRF
ncbi:MAG: porin, partial [Candidatus Entotheonellia bacterium]